MSLFRQRVLKNHTKEIQVVATHIDILRQWAENLNRGIFDSETQNDGEFIQRILIDVLGYVGSGRGSNWTIAKNQPVGSGHVDVALGHFTAESVSIVAPFELKGAKTELDAIMPGRNKTPVQQAWEYAVDAKGAKWVLVSNYREIRLYAFGYGRKDYESFDLAKLTDVDQYARFMTVLSAQNLLDGTTLALLRESVQVEKDITDELYKDYQTLRIRLIEDIAKNNSKVEKLHVIRHAQTILDCILFVAFAEDRGLLPDKMLQKAFTSSNTFNPQPIWENFKGLFRFIDKGNAQNRISGYNGGLFAENTDLNALKISDELCGGFQKIGEYDFNSEISVNILGHIFEQSMSDLEELKAQVEGNDVTHDKKTSKRKADGIFYTPSYITQYIVEQTVGSFLATKRDEIGFNNLPVLTDTDYNSIKKGAKGKRKGQSRHNENIEKHIKAWEAYKEVLSRIKVLDPACGSGAFLNEVFDYLYREGQAINSKLTRLQGDQQSLFRWSTHILTNNLYGVDLNSESVEITKLSLWLKTANQNEKLTYLDDNIKVGNSLIDDPTIVGDLAFDWQEEFHDIMATGGFDVVVGNPPWGAKVSDDAKSYMSSRYLCTSGELETYVHFIDLTINKLLKPRGIMGLITANTWFYLDKYIALRRLVLGKKINVLLELEKNIFKDAPDIVPGIFIVSNFSQAHGAFATHILRKGNVPHFLVDSTIMDSYIVQKNDILEFNNLTFNLKLTKEKVSLLKKMSHNCVRLFDLYNVRYGIKTGNNSKYVSSKRTNDSEWKFCIAAASAIKRYSLNWEGDYLNFGPHLSGYSENSFERPKILIQYIRKLSMDVRIISAFDKEGCYYPLNNFSFIEQKNEEYELEYLIIILNSTAMNFYFKNIFIDYNIKPKYLEKLPIKKISLSEQQPFITLAERMLSLNADLSAKRNRFLKRLRENFGDLKITKALENFDALQYKQFLAELLKQKIVLSLKQQDQWDDYFNDNKTDCQNLAAKIGIIDAEIDKRVYELYDLTEEEIKIVENQY